jgi:hypothetical protein
MIGWSDIPRALMNLVKDYFQLPEEYPESPKRHENVRFFAKFIQHFFQSAGLRMTMKGNYQ